MSRTTSLRVNAEYLAAAYLDAKGLLISTGYSWELDWQAETDLERVTESGFLREAAWVVLSSGFREAMVRRVFPSISAAFRGWISAEAILRESRSCRRAALAVFRNRRKIDAIIGIASAVAARGYEDLKKNVQDRGPDALSELPFIGPVTRYHLAKNIGVQVAKPDRHLRRVAELAGYLSPQALCEAIEVHVGDPVAVIDLVIWRTASLSSAYWPEVFRAADSRLTSVHNICS